MAKGTLGVTGRGAVGDMLEQRRVETLLVAALEDDEFVERAIEDALGQSAEVLHLRHHDETELPDGVAAVLRF